MIPRYGKPPITGVQYTLRPGAYAILPRQGHVMLTIQIGQDWDIQLPGGGIDPGESSIQALHREVLEETGWRIAKPVRLGAFQRFVYMPEYDLWAQKMCTIFVAHPVRQVADPTEPDHETVWTPFEDAVPILGNDGDRALLERYLTTV